MKKQKNIIIALTISLTIILLLSCEQSVKSTLTPATPMPTFTLFPIIESGNMPIIMPMPTFMKSLKSFIYKVAVFVTIMLLCMGVASAFADTTAGKVNIEIILDGSGSMEETIGGKSKIDIAREVILNVVDEILSKAPDTNIGLRVYGHQSDKNAHNCQDTKLEIPIGKIDISLFQNKLNTIKPKGYTLIAFSLQSAIKDFPKNESNYIILVTDGEETCGGDITNIAYELKKVRVPVHAVGYKIAGKEKETITPISTITGGKYFDAEDKEGLKMALNKITSSVIFSSYDFPTNKGSMLVSGSFSFSNSGGDVYGIDRQTTVNFSPSFTYFIIPNLGIGGDLGLTISNNVTILTIGPEISYFFGSQPKDKKVKGTIYPYINAALLYNGFFSNITNTSGFIVELGGGGIYMLSDTTGLYGLASYQIGSSGGKFANFNKFNIGVGLSIFFY